MKAHLLAPLIFALAQLCHAESLQSSDLGWLVGTWQKTQDEDGTSPDTLRFRNDGTWVAYGPDCEECIYKYFVHGGDVFLFIPIEKGPVALVYRPNSSHSALTFTSPRTRNNAVYEKVANPICGKDS